VGLDGSIGETWNGGVTWSFGPSLHFYSYWLTDITFSDVNHGWLVGEGALFGDSWDGFVFAVKDGGGMWTQQDMGSSITPVEVAFADAGHGWIVAWDKALKKSVVLCTNNGGTTWTRSYPASSGTLRSVACADAAHVWAGGDGVMLASADGGATWSAQDLGVSKATALGLAFSDVLHGWAVGYGGTILATTTGGVPPVIPTVSGFTPVSGLVGSTVIVSGTGFAGTTSVTFGGTAATTFDVISNTQVTAIVPQSAITGPITVTTPAGPGVSLTPFTVTVPPAAPSIGKVKPASAKRGVLVTISGTDFGAAQSTSSVKFGSKTCTTYVSWSAKQIKCKVPATAKYGAVKVTVTTTAGASNAKSFTVKR
jgi:hypothetical protein